MEELAEMWRDTVDLVKQAVEENRKAYVLVNNRSERNAPLTIQAFRTALHAAEILGSCMLRFWLVLKAKIDSV